MNRVQCRPDSELLDGLAVGRVMASRINDVMARPASKRHTGLLELLSRQIQGYGERDPKDQYRERELLPAALAAYEARHGVELQRGWFYRHPEYDMVGCAPDALERDLIGLTVHIRQTEETYEQAVEDSANVRDLRAAQVSMAVTGRPYWITLQYWQDDTLRRRRLYETLFERNPRSDELVHRMVWFYCEAAQAQ